MPLLIKLFCTPTLWHCARCIIPFFEAPFASKVEYEQVIIAMWGKERSAQGMVVLTLRRQRLALLGVGTAGHRGVRTQKPVLKGAQQDGWRFGWRCHLQSKDWVGVHIGRGDRLCKSKKSEGESNKGRDHQVSQCSLPLKGLGRETGSEPGRQARVCSRKKGHCMPYQRVWPHFTCPTLLLTLLQSEPTLFCYVALALLPCLFLPQSLEHSNVLLSLLSVQVLALLLINSVTLRKQLTSESLSFPNSNMEVILVSTLLGCGNVWGNTCHKHSAHIVYDNSTSVHAYHSDFSSFSSLPTIHMEVLVEILLPTDTWTTWISLFSDNF